MSEVPLSQNERQPWSRVSFSIYSEILSPSEIADVLDEEPTSSHQKGDQVSPRRPEGPFYKENMWSCMFDTDVALPFREHLQIMLEFVAELEPALITLQDRCKMRIFGSSSVIERNCFDISIEHIQLLARTNVSLAFDMSE